MYELKYTNAWNDNTAPTELVRVDSMEKLAMIVLISIRDCIGNYPNMSCHKSSDGTEEITIVNSNDPNRFIMLEWKEV